jgi:enoyl-CoA hydratase/carnithine racemase
VEQIEMTLEGGIAFITLNRPEKLNALTVTMEHELIAAFDATDADDDVRAVILTRCRPCLLRGGGSLRRGNHFIRLVCRRQWTRC